MRGPDTSGPTRANPALSGRGTRLLRFELSSSRSRQAIDITHLFTSRAWPEGLLLVSVEHTTAALFLGESGGEMFEDYERVAARLVADGGPFRHETWNPATRRRTCSPASSARSCCCPSAVAAWTWAPGSASSSWSSTGRVGAPIAVASLATQPLG